jgi:hypothetical protein
MAIKAYYHAMCFIPSSGDYALITFKETDHELPQDES